MLQQYIFENISNIIRNIYVIPNEYVLKVYGHN